MSHSVPARPPRDLRSAPAPGPSVLAGGSLFGGIAATFSASCCVLPLLMVQLGLGSALAANLAAFTAAQPYLVAVTLLLIGTSAIVAFRRGTPSRTTVVTLGVSALLVATAIVLPWFEEDLIRWTLSL